MSFELTVNDRVGVVTHSPGGSLAAAPLLLASVARYYELLRGQGDKFYRYPGYYVIHVGRQHAYHGWLDVWSANKGLSSPHMASCASSSTTGPSHASYSRCWE